MLHRKMMTVEQARQLILRHSQVGPSKRVQSEASLDHVIARDCTAPSPIPGFDRSPYDGYAVRAADTTQASRSAPVQLQEVETWPAGYWSDHSLQAQTCIRIMTGAPIPDGADAVVPLEQVQHDPQLQTIQVFRPLSPGDNVSRKGEDIAVEQTVLRAGHVIGAGEIAVLAALGLSHVDIIQPPIIGIVATGTELIDPYADKALRAPLPYGSLYDSNSIMLQARIARWGAQSIRFPILSDQEPDIYEKLTHCLQQCDILVTTGGASVGDFDRIPAWLQSIKAQVLFNKVNMRPGSVTTAALTRDRQWVFGLSGNPSACYVGFELFVRPLIQAWLTQPTAPATVQAVLLHDIAKSSPVHRYVRARLRYCAVRNNWVVQTSGLDKSGALSSLLNCNALLHLPPRPLHQPPLSAGSFVEVILTEPGSYVSPSAST
ncbi:molybdopterin molybdotransferase MoeA [Marinicrinis sediminis]|uniref:Molybdopterin molybdenumtransferase n=1 Tax=Marinicrinis sediminis TaxID=1652465 RepID=A0ABW5R5I0_9BACL